jgi:hypothetical protein
MEEHIILFFHTITRSDMHKTQNEEKQTNLRQHWAQNTERREANKSQATLGTKHRTKRSKQISGNIGHKTQNEEKQNNLGRLRFVCFSSFCVLCPMLPEIWLLLFVLCFVPNVA